jgi:DNA primase
MIPDDTIELIRESADIVQVIGEHVTLRRVGTDWRGPCPFHQGTRPNFSVSPRKKMYYCFVCHEGGDVFNFLQKRLGMDWPTAVRHVAERTGIEIREVESRREGPDPREPMWELNGAAGEYFQRMLWEDDLGRTAREYLASRNVTRETAERFGLGFAPNEIGLMRAHLNTLGFDDARLLEAGLMVQREEAQEPRPRFRGRLIFPILDVAGHLAGFGGRLIGDEARFANAPKYLNSAESTTFSKGKLLYGLNAARHAARRDDRMVVVEGYFDVVRLVGAGFEPVVAPLGTALTEDQAVLLSRYTKNIFLLYDSDLAGLKATFRAGDELLKHSLAVRVASLPEGEDPDTFVDKHGKAALEAQLDQAIDVFDRKVQILERGGWFADLHRRRQAIDRLLPTIRAAADPLTRDMYIARASEASGVDRTVLVNEVEAGPRGARRARGGTVSRPMAASQPAEHQEEARFGDRRSGERRRREEPRERELSDSKTAPAERMLVRVMLEARNRIERIAEQRGPDQFTDAISRAIYRALLDRPEATLGELAEVLSPAEAAVAEVLAEEGSHLVDIGRTESDSLDSLRRSDLRAANREIDRLHKVASEEEKNRLVTEKKRNTAEISEITRRLGGQAPRPPQIRRA